MNQMRMDAEGGGRVIHRRRRAGWLAVVVAVQNLLVIACFLVTLYVYWNFQSSEDDVYIKFDGTLGLPGNERMKLGDSYKAHMMEVTEDNKAIRIHCTGPYIFFMEVCYRNSTKNTTMLWLKVNGRKDPVSSFQLVATPMVCRGNHSIVYLKANEEASVNVNSSEYYIQNLTIGMSYLQGRKCDY